MMVNPTATPGNPQNDPERTMEDKGTTMSEPLTKRRSGAPLYAPDELSQKVWQLAAALPTEKQADLLLGNLAYPAPFRPQKVYEHNGHKYTKLRIEDVLVYCQTLGITIVDLFKACGYAYEWPTNGAKQLAARLPSLSQERLTKLRSIVIELSPAYWLPWSEAGRDPNPRKRAMTALARYPDWAARKKKLLASKYTTPSLEDYVKLSEALEIPLPWIFNWMNDTTGTLASPEVEFIVTGYLFSHGVNRKIIEAVANLEA